MKKNSFDEILTFIRSLYPRENPVPLHAPCFLGNEKKYLAECIDTTFVSYVGKFVTDFEDSIKKVTGSAHATAIVNGTAAIQIALLATGIKPGNEVITQALTFAATAAGICHAGGKPVFIDVERETLGMSPEALEDFLKNNTTYENGVLKNKFTGNNIFAVMPMHTFGHPVRIDEIKAICDHYELLLIEDAAESLGSYYKGKHTGTFGKAGILSFNGNKTVTTGGGGMIISDDEEFINKARFLSTTAKRKHPWEFIHDEIGYNYRMPNVNAAIGYAQMEYLNTIIENKRSTAQKYKDFFAGIGVDFFTEPKNAKSNYWLNAIFVTDRNERNSFLEYSNRNGVQTRPVWKLIPTLEPYKNCFSYNIKIAYEIEDRLVNIPSSYRV
jgi:aminotransferase in exopolysaccharide biosynthesis